jgi:hypothetical protein
MERELETSLRQPKPLSAADLPFFLFGGGGRRAVHCRARWVSDRYAYVVAPLATATAVKQQWNATAIVPSADGSIPTRERHVQVELVSAEELLGSDSGREGLLLRVLGSQRRLGAHAKDDRSPEPSSQVPLGH